MMKIIIAVGLLAVAVTGNPTDRDNSDFCLPADDEQFNKVFSEPFPGQYKWSFDGINFLCVAWDAYNARFNRTTERHLVDYPEERFLDNWNGRAKARMKACGSPNCK